MSLETNSELDQANLRIVVAGIAIVYISVLGFLPGQSLDTYLPVILYIALFLMVSIAFRQVIARWPGHYPARRIFGMIHDYTGTSFGTLEMRFTGSPRLVSDSVLRWSSLGLILLQPATPMIKAPNRVRRVTGERSLMVLLPWGVLWFFQRTTCPRAVGARCWWGALEVPRNIAPQLRGVD